MQIISIIVSFLNHLSCTHHDSSLLNISVCIFYEMGIFLHNHSTVVDLSKFNIDNIFFLIYQ